MKQPPNKLNIRYMGFEGTSAGGRRLTFVVTAPGRASQRVMCDIGAQAFIGESRISFQESAAVCYEKLRDHIERGDELPEDAHFVLTETEVQQFRPRGRRAAAPTKT